jgi:hypothetical protein
VRDDFATAGQMTIFQPPELDGIEFERQLQLIGSELAVLTDVLER